MNLPDQVLVAFPADVSDQVIAEVAEQYGFTYLDDFVVGPISLRVAKYLVSGSRSLSEVLITLQADSRITSAQLNFVYATSGSRTNRYPAKLLNLNKAHALSEGKGVRIAVIDTAVDLTHPALKDSIAANYDVLGSGKSSPDSHGTSVAGIMAAQGKFSGVAPGAKVLAIRAFEKSERGDFRTSDSFALLKSVKWAAANGADVLNLSFAGPHDPLFEQLLNAMAASGIIAVAAAGNNGPKAKPAYPAAYDSVVAVTAVDVKKRLFERANRGPHIFVAAPGVKILSTKPAGKYGFLTGTSMAAAYVSGIVALMLEKNPELGLDELRSQLTVAARDLGEPGRDFLYGYGLVDAHAAVQAALPGRSEDQPVSALSRTN